MAASSTSPSLIQSMEEMTRDADEVQQNLLAQILTQNADTEYLRGFGAVDNNTFRSKVPIVTYNDIQPLIRRMADGDGSPILCAQPISEFIMRSALELPMSRSSFHPPNKYWIGIAGFAVFSMMLFTCM